MHRCPLAIVPLLVAVGLTACNDSGGERRRPDGTASTPASAEPTAAPARPMTRPATRPGGEPPSTQPVSFTGTLRGGAVAIGGETTGWRIEGDGSTGGIDLDVSKVRERAQSLDGKRVSVTGKMTTRAWPERGNTQVLVVEKIEEAARGPATRGVPGGSR